MTPQFTSRYLPTKNEYEHRTCSRLSRAALFITGPEPERTQIPITRRLLDKLWYIHKHARFSAKWGQQLQIHATTRTNLTNVMLRNQTWMSAYGASPPTRHLYQATLTHSERNENGPEHRARLRRALQ